MKKDVLAEIEKTRRDFKKLKSGVTLDCSGVPI